MEKRLLPISKYNICYIILLIASIFIVSETKAQTKFSDKDIYVPNQLIVKLKDEVSVSTKAIESNKTSISKELDEAIFKNKVAKIERVFNENGLVVRNAKKLGLSKKYENILLMTATDDAPMNVKELQKQIQASPEVEYAEPNYIFSVDHTLTKTEDAIIKKKLTSVNNKFAVPSAVIPNDPFFTSQGNLQATKVPKVWETTTGDSIVIAVLDTGVDWEHPDLQGNIWENKAEKNGKPGIDDDGNGYVDDIRGWDWINNDNNPTDDNLHGTHVAGIIAARGDNNIGISGVNWYGKIMALKVMQSTGRGDAATIAQAVEYAATNGAKIINLSLGGYYESLTLKSALEKAYAKCFIAAAAGNDSKCIGPGIGCAPLYPAAYSFVMGVQDQALYSNMDGDGPFVSGYSDLLNYEIHAPGSSIMSLSPGGGYRTLTGTSMATPLVAGIASLYISKHPDYDKEFLFGHIINTENGFIDAEKVVLNPGLPNLTVPKLEILDIYDNCNKDGKPDAGETVNLRLYIKNTWAKAEGVSVKIGYEELADKSLVSFIVDSSYVGTISPNAIGYSILPLTLKISDKVYHGADYKIRVDLNDTKGDRWSQDVVITFQNGINFGGFLTSDVTLYPNKLYHVTENLIVDNCTMTIMPGTKLIFDNGKGMRTNGTGKILALGKKDSLITFSSNSEWAGITTTNYLPSSKFIYCVIENLGYFSSGIAQYPIIGGSYSKCIFKNNNSWVFLDANISQSNIINNKIYSWGVRIYGRYNNWINNNKYYKELPGPAGVLYSFNAAVETNVLNNQGGDFDSYDGSSVIPFPTNLYIGTDDSLTISRRIFDYFDNPGKNAVIIKNVRSTPFDQAPGMVWKLIIDGKEFASNNSKAEDIMELGTHTLQVWFNRAMDTLVTPSISFGQRSPYNQVIISNKGYWSADSTKYTVSKEFTIGDPKGIVNFNISGAKDDMGMEIPYERDRFRVNLQSTGSKSINFGTTALCGKVDLNWDNLRTSGSDIVGYNIYRRKKLADNTNNKFTLLNKKLVLDNQYRDYKVELDNTYEYLYTAVRAGLNNESDSSYVVAGKPLASKLADVNGDSTVTVLDIVGSVNYILQKDPAPFIFKQSDLNNDNVINVLDVIGIIDRVLNPVAGSIGSSVYDYNSLNHSGRVDAYRIQDTLYMRSTRTIAGIETAESAKNVKWLSWANDWEKIKTPNKKATESWMIYGFNKSLDAITDKAVGVVSGEIDPSKWIVSASDGTPLKVNYLGSVPKQRTNASDIIKISNIYPNPNNGQFKVCLEATKPVSKLTMEVYDLGGNSVYKQESKFDTSINVYNIDLNHQPKGIYILKLTWLEDSGRKELSRRVVIQ